MVVKKNKIKFPSKLSLDSTDKLIEIIGGTNSKEINEKEFIKHAVISSVFFDAKGVLDCSERLQTSIRDKESVEVRFTNKPGKYFDIKHIDIEKLNNRKGAVAFTEKKAVKHKDTLILCKFDKDGNYAVRNLIYNYFGHKVSSGIKSTLKNYTISHLWENTSHPYYFQSLWNVVLIPSYFSFLLDKKDNHSDLVKNIKCVFKRICWEFYSTDPIFKAEKISKPICKIFTNEEIKSLIESIDTLKAISLENNILEKASVDLKKKSIDKKDMNKIFALNLIDIIKNNKGKIEIKLFLTMKYCKNKFDLNFPLLKKFKNVNDYYDKNDRQRYYKDKFKIDETEYIFTNHLFPVNKKKIYDYLKNKSII
jgi:hypothetical protein